MSPQKSPITGALAKSTKSPVKSLPSTLKSSVKSRLSPSLNPSGFINGIVELPPASSNGSDPEYHANPDEISLGSSEDAEQAGPISGPHLLIEEIHDYNGPALHPDATSSPSNASKQGGKAGKAAAKTTTTSHKKETTKTLSASSRVKKGVAGSTDARKNVIEKSKSKPKTAEKQQQQREATGTQRDTRSRREQAEFGFDELDALLKRRRQERKKGS